MLFVLFHCKFLVRISYLIMDDTFRPELTYFSQASTDIDV